MWHSEGRTHWCHIELGSEVTPAWVQAVHFTSHNYNFTSRSQEESSRVKGVTVCQGIGGKADDSPKRRHDTERNSLKGTVVRFLAKFGEISSTPLRPMQEQINDLGKYNCPFCTVVYFAVYIYINIFNG